MSAICETYNSSHNILQPLGISLNVSVTTSEAERDHC